MTWRKIATIANLKTLASPDGLPRTRSTSTCPARLDGTRDHGVMKNKKVRSGTERTTNSSRANSDRKFIFPLILVTFILAGTAFWQFSSRPKQPTPAHEIADAAYHPHPKGELTFNRNIAPIVFENCATCHHAGQSTPFDLLQFADVKKRAPLIAKLTSERQMPPWLPEQGSDVFLNCRRLTVEQIGMIGQWAAEGAREGNPADLPPAPKFTSEWRLGKPDLVVTMPKLFRVPPEGRDVYRNFAIPVEGLSTQRFVRALEFRPTNPALVHHAFIRVVNTSQWRRMEGKDGEPGFPGMDLSDEMPTGHFLGWQRGRPPIELPSGLAWPIKPGQDLILQTHLSPTGKPEELMASIGLYFTDEPPTNTPFKMVLSSYAMEIPAGDSNYVVRDDFILPIDVDLLAILPHAHYLAHEMHGWATFPGGEERELILIKQWNFDWQGDYRYQNPVFLPKGTKLSMRFTYDNSTNNIRNPHNPPRLVTHGTQTIDEMAELWFQLLPRRRDELNELARAASVHLGDNMMAKDHLTLSRNPNDAGAHLSVGQLLYQQNKTEEAIQHLRAALAAAPNLTAAHYYLGLIYRQQNKLPAARREFEIVLQLDPKDEKAHGNLAFIFAEFGDAKAAYDHFSAALAINPDDDIARQGMEQLIKIRPDLVR